MRFTATIVAFSALGLPCSAQSFRFDDGPKAGTLTLHDGERPVLAYCYGDQIKEGVDPKFTRSCYIHPLYDLDGQALTDDFPADHWHHRGISWTWPRMKARGKSVQTWAPSPLRQCFVAWLKREAGGQAATLSVQNEWKLADERVGLETVTLVAHPADEMGRVMDVTLTFEAVGGPVELLGADKKGYGGLCLRGAADLKGSALTTDAGPLKQDGLNTPFKWADMSSARGGVALLVLPDHPEYPPTWMVRNSYAGILNVSWPGLKPYTLEPGAPLTLRYRLYVHRGNAQAGRVAEAFRR